MWRATILDFSFQSSNVFTLCCFYAENVTFFILWVIFVQPRYVPAVLTEKVMAPITGIFILSTAFSIFLIFAIVGMGLHKVKSPFIRSGPYIDMGRK